MPKEAVEVIIFDMDKTLLSCDSMDLWHHFLERLGITTQQDRAIRKQLCEEYRDGTLDINKNFKFEFLILNRIPNNQKLEIQDYFFNTYLQPMFSKRILNVVTDYREKGAFIILSTSSMHFIASPVATFINANHLLATDGVISNNLYTGEIDGSPNYQEGKKVNFLNWLRHSHIILEKVIFFTDSINDISLLEAVDVPIAVNPDDKLRKRAQEEGWKVMNYSFSTEIQKLVQMQKNLQTMVTIYFFKRLLKQQVRHYSLLKHRKADYE